jgi:hypothetical protein
MGGDAGAHGAGAQDCDLMDVFHAGVTPVDMPPQAARRQQAKRPQSILGITKEIILMDSEKAWLERLEFNKT